jgi:pyruvate/2-oxoglutarate dehydrogenase complex dihydrolipoamide dehydrogenase (E3) component
MAPQTYSTIVIGAGSGGLTVAIGLAALGRKVALVEGHHVGGDCTNVGCVPSKTLIHQVNHREHGADSRSILATVQTKRNNLRDQETEHVQHTDNLELITGWARFLGPKQLEITRTDGAKQTISADNIVIATGSRPRRLEILGLPADRTLTNESVFELQEAPRHLAIIGSGVIAMEMAFAFHKLGTQITVITRSRRVLSTSIPEASEALHEALIDRGIPVHYQATPQSYDAASEMLHAKGIGGAFAVTGVDYVLLAAGRVRNLERLNLEQSGVAFGEHGIGVDSYGQTNVPGVFAIGDVTPTSHFTHSANAQGRRVVQRIAFPFLPARGPEPFYPSATFSDPEVADVGMTQGEIARSFHPNLIKRLRIDLSALDRGYTDSVRHGFIIVDVVRLTGRILHATLVGPHISEMLPFFTLAISERISLYRIYRMVQPYPTLAGGIQKIADAFMRETLPNLRTELPTYLRYRFATPPKMHAQAALTSARQSS